VEERVTHNQIGDLIGRSFAPLRMTVLAGAWSGKEEAIRLQTLKMGRGWISNRLFFPTDKTQHHVILSGAKDLIVL